MLELENLLLQPLIISYPLILSVTAAIEGAAAPVSEILLFQKEVIGTLSKRQPLDHCLPLFVQIKILTVYILHRINHILPHTKTNHLV